MGTADIDDSSKGARLPDRHVSQDLAIQFDAGAGQHSQEILVREPVLLQTGPQSLRVQVPHESGLLLTRLLGDQQGLAPHVDRDLIDIPISSVEFLCQLEQFHPPEVPLIRREVVGIGQEPVWPVFAKNGRQVDHRETGDGDDGNGDGDGGRNGAEGTTADCELGDCICLDGIGGRIMWCSRKRIAILFFAFNLSLTLFLYCHLQWLCDNRLHSDPPSSGLLKDILTIAVVDYEVDADHRVHDLDATLSLICQTFPAVTIVIFSDKVLYPPLEYIPKACKILYRVSESSAASSYQEECIDKYIRTDYVLLLPDFTRFPVSFPSDLSESLAGLSRNEIRVIPSREYYECQEIDLNIRTWTLTVKESGRGECEHVSAGPVTAFLTASKTLLSLSQPLLKPVSESLFIQAKARGVRISVSPSLRISFHSSLETDRQLRMRLDYAKQQRMQQMYRQLGIRKVMHEDGAVEWYGCSKETVRCFPTIVNDMPSYLNEGKWTPACCLENLRKTSRHVIRILESYNIRYWLEGGSLLGAVRNGDIIPWDSDVDIGVHEDDLSKLKIFADCKNVAAVKDEHDFVWEAAREEGFFRVHFSPKNRLHVDIFPFREENGTMTKDKWMPHHPQDRPFPAHFLKPMDRLIFAGIHVFVPNRAREFLELKFGPGVIDDPRLPNKQTP